MAFFMDYAATSKRFVEWAYTGGHVDAKHKNERGHQIQVHVSSSSKMLHSNGCPLDAPSDTFLSPFKSRKQEKHLSVKMSKGKSKEAFQQHWYMYQTVLQFRTTSPQQNPQ